ncbi:MAG TPA: thioredoxin [Terrisporobacter glycolicus]|nr:thioredoxin [Terrisporobacter hibernicus]
MKYFIHIYSYNINLYCKKLILYSDTLGGEIMAKLVNNSQFYNKIRTSDKLVVMDFFATWCGPCKMLAPIFESLSNEMSDKVDFAQIDIDRSLEVVEEYKIVSVPTMIIFKNGKEVQRIVGFVPKEQIKSKIKAHL